jgi:hypothetical protein
MMRTIQRTGARWHFVSIIVTLSCLNNTATSQEMTPDDWKRGFNGFAMLCRSEGMAVVSDRGLLQNPPRDLLVVVFGGAPGEHGLTLLNVLNRRGAILLAADDQRSSASLVAKLGVRISSGPIQVRDEQYQYSGYSDCVRIPSSESTEGVFGTFPHPVTDGLREIVANRAGYLTTSRRAFLKWQTIAETSPATAPTGSGAWQRTFMKVAENAQTGSRALVVADHSIFTNQMLAVADNAQLASQAIAWLGEGKTRVIILVDRDIVSPNDPSLVDIELPQPSPQQVRDALASLPPDEFLAAINGIGAVIEDEGILNEVIDDAFRKIPNNVYNWWMIVGASCILAFVGVSWAVTRRGTGDANATGDELPGARSQSIVNRIERHEIANQVLDGFRVDVTGSAKSSWDEFVHSVRVVGNPMEAEHLKKTLQLYRTRKPSYWTERRLEDLKSQLDHWRHLLLSGALEYERRTN